MVKKKKILIAIVEIKGREPSRIYMTEDKSLSRYFELAAKSISRLAKNETQKI